MNRDSQIILLFITIVGCLLLVSHEGLTAQPDEVGAERGPIRRELARIAKPAVGAREQEFREQRLHRYAWAISDAADAHPYPSRSAMVAALISIGKHESDFDEAVCEDFDHPSKSGAVGCWQYQLGREEPPPTTVEEAARFAARDLARHWRGVDFACAVSRYATGKASCSPLWSGAHKRVGTWARVFARMGRGASS